MYSINYDCFNCGCETKESFKKGQLAPNTTKCKNCGCIAQKIIVDNKPVPDEIPLPKDYKWPSTPWTDKYYPSPWDKPYKLIGESPFKKIMDGDFPQPSYNDNVLKDGHWTVCSVPIKKG